MTDIQKAIEYFEGYGSPYDDVVIKALEKQIPEKATLAIGRFVTLDRCPTCEQIFFCHDCILNYCSNCGQKIDWEAEDD